MKTPLSIVCAALAMGLAAWGVTSPSRPLITEELDDFLNQDNVWKWYRHLKDSFPIRAGIRVDEIAEIERLQPQWDWRFRYIESEPQGDFVLDSGWCGTGWWHAYSRNGVVEAVTFTFGNMTWMSEPFMVSCRPGGETSPWLRKYEQPDQRQEDSNIIRQVDEIFTEEPWREDTFPELPLLIQYGRVRNPGPPVQ